MPEIPVEGTEPEVRNLQVGHAKDQESATRKLLYQEKGWR